MSTDYRTCECGETFADCADGYREEVITHEDGSKEEIRSCNFCRGDDFGDKELLEFVTSAIGVSRDDLVNFYKRYKMTKLAESMDLFRLYLPIKIVVLGKGLYLVA